MSTTVLRQVEALSGHAAEAALEAKRHAAEAALEAERARQAEAARIAETASKVHHMSVAGTAGIQFCIHLFLSWR